MKLHSLSVPYRAASSVTRLAWVLVFASLGSQQAGFGLEIAVAIVVAGLAVAFAYQLAFVRRFEYELTDDTFDLSSGVLSRRTREIPYRRVQNVDVSRDPVQRALGLAEVRVETAGGGDTEAILRFVGDAEADRLQREIGRRKRGDDPSTAERPRDEASHELYAVSPTELALLGLVKVDLRILSGATVLLPLLLPSVSETFPLVSLFAIAPLLLVGVVGIALVASSVVAITSYYGFRLWRVDDELRYERGLLQQYSGTIPLDKVQALTLTENVVSRRIGYASLEVETAGYGPGDQAGSQSAVPLADRERALALARKVEPFGEVSFDRPPKRARLRYAVRYGLVVLVLVAAGFLVSRLAVVQVAVPWFAPIVLLPLAPVAAHLKWRHLGYALTEDHVVTREGFWTRTTTVVPYYRVQTLVERATVFQRRRRLATLIVDTAGLQGFRGRDARAIDIDAGRATALREELDRRFRTSLARTRRLRRSSRFRVTRGD